MLNFAVENEGITTPAYDMFEWHVEFVCALWIAQNYCKLQYFLKVIMCGKSLLKVEYHKVYFQKPLHFRVAPEEVFAGGFEAGRGTLLQAV